MGNALLTFEPLPTIPEEENMKSKSVRLMMPFLALLLAIPGTARAQGDPDLTQMLVESYDLLEAGKLDQAQQIFTRILAQDPGNPLALNNLAAIKVKKEQYREALKYLEQALPRARGYKLKVNRVCGMEGACLAFRPLADAYGDQELESLVRLNLDLVKARLGQPQK